MNKQECAKEQSSKVRWLEVEAGGLGGELRMDHQVE